MAEIVVTPTGREALEAGTFTDDDGCKFVGLTFRENGGDTVVVTFTPTLFREWLNHMQAVAQSLED